MSSNPKPLKFEKPRSIVYQIYKTLGRAIANFELKPDEFLKEQELQKSFGVSRAPIREAIRLLEADGLVIVDAFKKKWVRRITRDDLQEIIPVMACLEGFAANQACERIKEEQIDSLERINEKMKAASAQGNYDLCAKLNVEFHGIYIKAADNKTLRRAIKSIVKSHMWFFMAHTILQNRDLANRSIEEHKRIIELFRKKDRRKLEEEVREHIYNQLQRFFDASVFDSEGNYKFSSQA